MGSFSYAVALSLKYWYSILRIGIILQSFKSSPIPYFTKRSLRVEQSDESHVSFESSSSVFPNHDEDDFLAVLEEVSFEFEDFLDELDPVMKFSIAFPIILASTMLLPSHFNLLSGDRDSLALGLPSPALVSVLSRNLSIASFAKDTVGLVGLTDFRLAIAG